MPGIVPGSVFSDALAPRLTETAASGALPRTTIGLVSATPVAPSLGVTVTLAAGSGAGVAPAGAGDAPPPEQAAADSTAASRSVPPGHRRGRRPGDSAGRDSGLAE
ncbi:MULTISPECIES: hypothetical protein [Frankia]|uniref:hypothetical protein n=1 Tax=Frankia TaxID=1854 RepID=UPI00040FF30F|nr:MULTISPECIES: hypothetical protein [Frankia]